MLPDDVWLVPSQERTAEVDALAARLGAPVGLAGVLADLNRTARRTRSSGVVASAFRWDHADERTRRWFPQGITSSADHDPTGLFEGRRVLLTSAYARPVRGVRKGARLSVVDLDTLGYRHVLLVEPGLPGPGPVEVRPVGIHAGGIVWHGPWVHVGATARGLYSFRLEDILRAPASRDRSRLGFRDGGFDGFGYRYVLPLRRRYVGEAAPGRERLRYSFLSLERGPSQAHLVVGEYARAGMTRRLTRFEVDPATYLPRPGPDGVVRPVELHDSGVDHLQGAAVVDGRWYATTSAGLLGRGSVWSGPADALVSRGRVLPPGPEDLAYSPSSDRLWTQTEHPLRRRVLALDRAALDRQASG